MSSVATSRSIAVLDLVVAAMFLVIIVWGSMSAANASAVNDRVRDLWLSPQLSHLAVRSDAGVTLYRIADQVPIASVEGATQACFAPANERVAIAAHDELFIYDLRRDTPRTRLPTEPGLITSLAFSPSGDRLATLGADSNVLRVWDMKELDEHWQAIAHEDAHYGLAFSSDGSTIATGGTATDTLTYQARLWDSRTGALLHTLVGPRHAYVQDITFLEGAQRLMVHLSDARTNAIWDLSGPDTPSALSDDPLGSTNNQIVMSPGHRHFSSIIDQITWKVTYGVFDRTTGKQAFSVGPLDGMWGTARFSPDGTRIMVASSHGDAELWDVDTGTRIASYAGLRRTEWSHEWTILIALLVVWIPIWMTGYRRSIRQSGNRPQHISVSLLLAALTASGFLGTVHWLQVADVTATPDPISTLFTLLLLEAVVAFILAAVSFAERSWLSLGTTVLAFVFIGGMTMSLLGAVLASV